MVSVIAPVACHYGPQNPRVLVGQCYSRFLPATTFAQSLRPLRDGVIVVLAGQHGRLRTLYQQGAQVVVAALGDAAQTGLAATGILFGCQSQPGAELSAILELFEVTDGSHDSGGGDGADAFEFGGALNLFIVFLVGSNALVAPLDMHLQLSPVFLGSLQY